MPTWGPRGKQFLMREVPLYQTWMHTCSEEGASSARVQSRFRVLGLAIRVEDLGFRAVGLGARVWFQGLGFRI